MTDIVGQVSASRVKAKADFTLESHSSNADNTSPVAVPASSNVMVRVDANLDGKTDTGELTPLDGPGVTATPLTYNVQSALVSGVLPNGLGSDAATPTSSGSLIIGGGGTLIVGDGVTLCLLGTAGASVSLTLAGNMANTSNTPVIANALAEQSATEDAAFSFTVPSDSFADVDAGDVLRYSASLDNGEPLPEWLSFDAATRTFSGTPGNADVGSLNLQVTATDAAGASVSQSFAVAVANTNDAPVIVNAFDAQTATAGTAFSFTLPDTAFSDADAGDTLSYNVTLADGQPLPAWLVFDAATRTLSGTPAQGDAGDISFSIAATDQAGVSASQELRLKVEASLNVGVTRTGDSRNNRLTGTAGNDTLDGGAGRDRMIGAAGDDTYYVDNRRDVLVERAGEGDDTVISTVSHRLADNLENLVLTGHARLSGTGNGLDNRITGNAGNNTLNGRAGADTLTGAAGNDTYYVDNIGDVIIEHAGEGTDRVIATVSTTLSDNVETLTLAGRAAIDGYGNALNNTLTGNAASNHLQGGAGNDRLYGRAGLDFLEGDDGNDRLFDKVDAGYFNGGAGDDQLIGGVWDDLFIGGQGNDTLTSGSGNDVILFNKGDGQDLITREGKRGDTLSLGGQLAYTDLAFSKVGKNLVLTLDTADQITFQDWYAARPSRPVLKLQVIAEAMAGFDAGGSDPLLDQKVESFDFTGLANAFDAARKAAPTLNRWSLTQALLDFQLAGSDDAAIGGDLAYQYGKTGDLSGMSLAAAQALISDSAFGTQAQALQSPGRLQEGMPRLS
jgi:hypothetical protein